MEYVIWGISPQQKESDLLLEFWNGKRITDKTIADHCVQGFENAGFTKVYIQSIDLSKPFSFVNAIIYGK